MAPLTFVWTNHDHSPIFGRQEQGMTNETWYVFADGAAEPLGPFSTELIVRGIKGGKIPSTAKVCKVGTEAWLPIDSVGAFGDALLAGVPGAPATASGPATAAPSPAGPPAQFARPDANQPVVTPKSKRKGVLIVGGALGIAVLFAAGFLVLRQRGPSGLVRGYTSASCADRVTYVLDPAKYARSIAEHGGGKCGPENIVSIDDGDCHDVATAGRCVVRTKLQAGGEQTFCVVRGPEGLKIDWPCSVGWSKKSVAAFKTDRDGQPSLFRVRAKLDPRTGCLSARLADQGASMLAGIPSQRASARRLREVLADGSEHRIMVEVAYSMPHQEQCTEGTPLITRFVASGWWSSSEEGEQQLLKEEAAEREVQERGAAAERARVADRQADVGKISVCCDALGLFWKTATGADRDKAFVASISCLSVAKDVAAGGKTLDEAWAFVQRMGGARLTDACTH